MCAHCSWGIWWPACAFGPPAWGPPPLSPPTPLFFVQLLVLVLALLRISGAACIQFIVSGIYLCLDFWLQFAFLFLSSSSASSSLLFLAVPFVAFLLFCFRLKSLFLGLKSVLYAAGPMVFVILPPPTVPPIDPSRYTERNETRERLVYILFIWYFNRFFHKIYIKPESIHTKRNKLCRISNFRPSVHLSVCPFCPSVSSVRLSVCLSACPPAECYETTNPFRIQLMGTN